MNFIKNSIDDRVYGLRPSPIQECSEKQISFSSPQSKPASSHTWAPCNASTIRRGHSENALLWWKQNKNTIKPLSQISTVPGHSPTQISQQLNVRVKWEVHYRLRISLWWRGLRVAHLSKVSPHNSHSIRQMEPILWISRIPQVESVQ